MDERYRLEVFRQRADAGQETRSLSDELQEEILRELHLVIRPKMEEIISRLNRLGHNLHPYGNLEPGDIGYRDDYEHEGRYNCRLRVGVDVVVSVGYADTLETEDEPENDLS